MELKLKSILAVALCAVGFAAVPSVAKAQMVTASEAYFYPAKADIAPKDDNRSHYQAYIIESADDGDAVLAQAKEKGMSGIDSEKTAAVVNDKLGWQFAISEYGVTSLDIGAFSPASFDLTDNAYLVVFYHTDGVASEVCVLGAEPEKLEEDKLYFDADPFCSEGYNSGWQEMPPPVPEGSEENPWQIGSPNAADVKAWTNGTGKLTVEGTGKTKDYEMAQSPFFNAREGIVEAEIGEGVTDIGNNLFFVCQQLKNVSFASTITNIGNSAFYTCSALTNVTLKGSVDCIGSEAFASNSELVRLEARGDVGMIKDKAFHSCAKLESVSIQGNLDSLAEAFKETSRLADFAVGGNVGNIASGAFSNASTSCPDGARIFVGGNVGNVGSSAFSGAGFTEIKIGGDLRGMASQAFFGLSKLILFEVDGNVGDIPTMAFSGLSELTLFAVGGDVGDIAGGSFSNVGLSSSDGARFVIGGDVGSVGSSAFSGAGFTEIKIGGNLRGMDTQAFFGLSKLTLFEVDGNVGDIPTMAFLGVSSSSLDGMRVLIGGGVGNVGGQAFNGSGLKEIKIGGDVKGFGDHAFQSCSKLESVTLVTAQPPSMGTDVFWYSDNLKAIYVPHGMGEAYKAAPGWSDYKEKIVELDPPISAVSAEGFLDLTVGDRVAKAEELVVVDPAWGEAKKATVDFTFGASTVETRTYNCASNDLWETTTLTPGRYTLALTAGDDNETAAFWKTGDDWVIFDNSNITADVTFEADKTYLMLGTNTVNGNTLTVTDGAKFAYAAGAGFKGGTVAELPKRYGKKTVGDLYQIYEKIKGSKDNPWDVGVGVEAYTNGTDNLVIVGADTIADLSEIPSEVKRGIAAITVGDGVTDAAAGVFFGFDKVTVTLQDNWKGELPDEKDTWCGATNVELTRVPTAVKNVKVQQRYPWNGKVDVDFDLTGEGSVKVTVQVTVDGEKLKNPTVDGETTFDLGKGKELKDLRLTWDAKQDFGDAEKHEKIKVKLSVEKAESN